jgi:hypothetical protein
VGSFGRNLQRQVMIGGANAEGEAQLDTIQAVALAAITLVDRIIQGLTERAF